MRAPVEERIPTRGAGAWLASRSGGARLHAGVDIRMGRDTECVAPEAGEVVTVATSSTPSEVTAGRSVSVPPGWRGYGPMVVLLAGDSGVWHVLAHLDTVRVHPGQRVVEGAVVGVGSRLHHVHWEVRVRPRPVGTEATVETTLDPGAWLRGERVPYAGQCPPSPGSTRQTPRGCRPGAARPPKPRR